MVRNRFVFVSCGPRYYSLLSIVLQRTIYVCTWFEHYTTKKIFSEYNTGLSKRLCSTLFVLYVIFSNDSNDCNYESQYIALYSNTKYTRYHNTLLLPIYRKYHQSYSLNTILPLFNLYIFCCYLFFSWRPTV